MSSKAASSSSSSSSGGDGAQDQLNGIRRAPFIEDVEAVMKKEQFGKTAEEALRVLDHMYSRYKMIEATLESQRQKLEARLPDLKSTLAAVSHVEKANDGGEELKTTFSLTDNAHVGAKITDTSKVCLWLGANVMLEYDVAEAKTILQSHIEQAESKLKVTLESLDYVRDQQTTMEVNMARVYNWDVARRRRDRLP
ncbi:hypothetical protein PTSG_02924 [Salpingoeca rosetta]|uniref:Prefoldin subunit 3 n=1 Tax=Salpingoeca rosetta (strain ATCC 50818 / BSB-021) TaxID=946362 RepID=F2U3R0_SALR5|nr:uncharacterized protein PTSG_02924 [Salpingoeca rosetta]EGD82254.1 hypothetical protein PTSG_02924 [Salpingoeca rosetta]|eukprot:XP_004996437.1 hypothetical protein PTSG_02924 [Salpingoeca rosetta]